MAEILDVYDSDMNKTGSLDRESVHKLGLWHVVAHIWLIDIKEDKVSVYFQKRSMNKAQQPGLFDIAVGGHISSGENAQDGAVREMYEEMGILADRDKLIYLGRVKEDDIECDREFGEVFLYILDLEPKIGEEVEMYVKIDAEDYFEFLNQNKNCVKAVCENGEIIDIPSDKWCLHPNEFENIVYPFIKKLKI